MKRSYEIKMPDGSWWAISAGVIAAHYAVEQHRKGGDAWLAIDRMLHLFDIGAPEFENYARNNMCWEDVQKYALLIETPVPVDFDGGWQTGICRYRTEKYGEEDEDNLSNG